MITIEGKKYEVNETLGWQQVGLPAKAVQTESGERIAVKRGMKWVWWTVENRTQPMQEEPKQ